MRYPLVLALLLAPLAASAVPTTLNHQGRLSDSTGQPLSGATDIGFSLHDAETAGTEVWREDQSLVLDDGYFSARLGSSEALDAALLDQDLWLAIAVDGSEVGERQPLNSVPYAILADAANTAVTADSATSVSGGVVDASELQINGATVLSADGTLTVTEIVINGSTVLSGDTPLSVAFADITEVPSSLPNIACTEGQLLAWSDSAGWGCTDPATSSDEDTLGALSCADGDVARFDGSNWVCQAYGSFDGGLVIGDTSDDCTDDNRGALKYADSALSLCGADGWIIVTGGSGTSESSAATTCRSLHNDRPELPTGVYWIKPDSGPAFEAFCDMTTQGGGWTLVSQGRPVADASLSLCNGDAVGTLQLDEDGFAGPAKLADATVNALWDDGGTHELLTKMVEDGSGETRGGAAFSQICRANFKNDVAWDNTTQGSFRDLEDPKMDCDVGNSWTATRSWSGNGCGFDARSAGDDYLIYTALPSYQGGACGSAKAGRSWSDSPNWGCNQTKHFVR